MVGCNTFEVTLCSIKLKFSFRIPNSGSKRRAMIVSQRTGDPWVGDGQEMRVVSWCSALGQAAEGEGQAGELHRWAWWGGRGEEGGVCVWLSSWLRGQDCLHVSSCSHRQGLGFVSLAESRSP